LTADKVIDAIEATLVKFARIGFGGAPRDHLSPGLRGANHKGFNILFRIVGNDMQIIRIVRGARDIRKLDFTDTD